MEAADALTVRDMAIAVGKVSGGNFTAVNNWDIRDELASQFGAPIFAIKHFSPELLERQKIDILVGNADWLDVDGGRWLTLYAKTLGVQSKITFTLCTKAVTKVARRAGKLLLQAAQPRVVSRWYDHLSKLESKPDLLMLLFNDGPRVLDDGLAEAIKQIPGCALLVGCSSHVEAVIAQHVLRAHGFACSESANYRMSTDQLRLFGPGAWWLGATIPHELTALESDPTTLEAGHELWAYVRDRLRNAKGIERGEFLFTFGDPLDCDKDDGSAAQVLMIDNNRGVDLASNRVVPVNLVTPERQGLRLPKLPKRMKEAMPHGEEGESKDSLRFRRMVWIRDAARWLTDIDASSAGSPSRGKSDTVTDVEKDPAEKPPTSEEEAVESAVSIGAIQSSDDEPTSPDVRPRLSRAAGKVEVLVLAGRLGRPGESPDELYARARQVLVDWLKKKGFSEPTDRSVVVELPQGELAIESDRDSVWAFRLDDRRTLEQAAMWRVEVTLVRSAEAAIGVRLSQIRQLDSPAPSQSGVPSFLVDIADKIGLSDAGIPAMIFPVALDGERGARTLISSLTNRSRTQSVIVCLGGTRQAVVESLAGLARRLVGVAMVVHLDQGAAEHLRQALGPTLGVANRAVRIYAPGLCPDDDSDGHPWWRMDGSGLSKSVADEIFESACAISLRDIDLQDRVPGFQVVRELLSQRRVDHLTSEATSKAISAKEKAQKYLAIREELQRQVEELRAQLAEGKERIVQLEAELRMTVRERQVAHDQVRALQYQLNVSRTSAAVLLDQQDDQPVYPDTWDELEQWVESYGQDRLVLLPKAAKAARRSPFHDIPLAYKALDYLARFYVPMKTRSPDDAEPLERATQFLEEHGLEDSLVGDATEDRRYKSDYECIYSGKSVTLDRHLKRRGGFDPAQVFRLYYHYDSDGEKVVVGHLPTHLTNRATHSS